MCVCLFASTNVACERIIKRNLTEVKILINFKPNN